MHYVLILLMFGTGKAAMHIEFKDKPACEAAISKMEYATRQAGYDAPLSRWVFTVCVPKGSEVK